MRILRWAADKASSKQEAQRLLAVATLDALERSKPALLQPEDQGMLDAVLEVLLAEATAAVEAYPDDSGNYDVEVAEDG